MVNSTPIALLAGGPARPGSAGPVGPALPQNVGRVVPLATTNYTRSVPQDGARRSSLYYLCTVFFASISPLLVVSISGCAGPHPSTPTAPATAAHQPFSERLEADWDDIDAAAEVGTGQAECVVVRAQTLPDGLERRFDLKHVSGLTGRLVVRLDPHGPRPTTPGQSRSPCEMGPLGTPELEKLIVKRVAKRLSDLKGVEFAPIKP